MLVVHKAPTAVTRARTGQWQPRHRLGSLLPSRGCERLASRAADDRNGRSGAVRTAADWRPLSRRCSRPCPPRDVLAARPSRQRSSVRAPRPLLPRWSCYCLETRAHAARGGFGPVARSQPTSPPGSSAKGRADSALPRPELDPSDGDLLDRHAEARGQLGVALAGDREEFIGRHQQRSREALRPPLVERAWLQSGGDLEGRARPATQAKRTSA